MAAPTCAATGSEPGFNRQPSVSTPSRSRSWVAVRRAASTGLARASVNRIRPRRGSAELNPSTAAMPARVRSRSESPATRDRGLDLRAELRADLVVDGAEQIVGIGEALVEVAGVQPALAAHRPHRHRGLTAVTEQAERGVDQLRTPFGAAVGQRHAGPSGRTGHHHSVRRASQLWSHPCPNCILATAVTRSRKEPPCTCRTRSSGSC